jgi:hypothetical protein
MIRFLCLATLCAVQSCAQSIKQPPKDAFLLAGRTTDTLPFLEYGLGEDRLGGAKMTFLDTSIMIKAVDSIKNVYKVQLS